MKACRQNAAIVLFSAQPFTTDLISSNRKLFRYEIIWEKTQKLGFLNAKKMPLRAHENICVFYRRLPTYNPQKFTVEVPDAGRVRKQAGNRGVLYGKFENSNYTEDGTRYPTDVIRFSNWNGVIFGKKTQSSEHPTRKPVDLLEYLIKTYTNEGDTVLDFCMGEGSTGEACRNLNRNFIGIELNDAFFRRAQEKLSRTDTGDGPPYHF